MQGVTCEMPGCQQQAVAQCQGDIRFCPQCDGPKAYSGCGRLLCQAHMKWTNHESAIGERVCCNTEECHGTAKNECMKMTALYVCCQPFACCICMCGKGMIEKGLRYRSHNGVEMYKIWMWFAFWI